MATIFIFHGTAGYPEENWFPWLKSEMEQHGFDVVIPQFPTPENQTLEAWFDVFRKFESLVDDETTIVGHSLGGAFLLRLLEKIPVKIAVACLVAAPVGIPGTKNWETDKAFVELPFDWKAIQQHAEKFLVFHSDDDPYVPLTNGEEAARQLNVPLHFIPNAGHFNKAAGYIEFPQLRDAILTTLKD
ncbi:MAG: hypothetical protein HOO67_04350 [Candidatus Peribacteraceae bacterium]|nr:hypothetical protein [Candidatus Peribacteraceae bacterium]